MIMDTGCFVRGRDLGLDMVRVGAAKPRCTARASCICGNPRLLTARTFVCDCSAVPGQDNGRVPRGTLMQVVEELPLGNLLDIVQAFSARRGGEKRRPFLAVPACSVTGFEGNQQGYEPRSHLFGHSHEGIHKPLALIRRDEFFAQHRLSIQLSICS